MSEAYNMILCIHEGCPEAFSSSSQLNHSFFFGLLFFRDRSDKPENKLARLVILDVIPHKTNRKI